MRRPRRSRHSEDAQLRSPVLRVRSDVRCAQPHPHVVARDGRRRAPEMARRRLPARARCGAADHLEPPQPRLVVTAAVLFADRTRPIAFVFTDIVGSTEKLTALGEASWLRALNEHNYVVRDVVDAYGGNAHKFLGDGWMVTFASPHDAIAAAVAIQRELSRDPSPEGFRVRIGVHTGTALATGDDFLGKDVVLAS